uniref:Uncharacterized protein n=1 Tax=Tetranychus urticae TaxID=32264 RepID=T1JWZ2_TETUR
MSSWKLLFTIKVPAVLMAFVISIQLAIWLTKLRTTIIMAKFRLILFK